MRGLSAEDTESIIAIERACSTLSLLGCVFVLVSFSLSDAFRQRAINRMVFYATFGNMLTNVATLMTTTYTHDVNAVGCQLQAFLIQVYEHLALVNPVAPWLTVLQVYARRCVLGSGDGHQRLSHLLPQVRREDVEEDGDSLHRLLLRNSVHPWLHVPLRLQPSGGKTVRKRRAVVLAEVGMGGLSHCHLLRAHLVWIQPACPSPGLWV